MNEKKNLLQHVNQNLTRHVLTITFIERKNAVSSLFMVVIDRVHYVKESTYQA